MTEVTPGMQDGQREVRTGEAARKGGDRVLQGGELHVAEEVSGSLEQAVVVRVEV